LYTYIAVTNGSGIIAHRFNILFFQLIPKHKKIPQLKI